jgi:hypothetical protein
MKNLKLTPIEQMAGSPKSIEVHEQGKLLATIYVDGEILIHGSFYKDELDQISFIAGNFFLFFNNIQKAL